MIAPPKFYQRAREVAARVQGPAPFLAKKSGDRGSLYIYDDIGESLFSTGITAKDVAAKLEEMGNVKALDIYINSAGGSVFEGVAILAQLERFKAAKTVYVDGIAASIASVIAMAGDRIVMHRSAEMMIHDPWTVTVGGEAEHLASIEILNGIRENIVAAYGRHAKAKPDEIRELMRSETWMSAEDAMARGLAHEIAKDPDEEMPEEEEMPGKKMPHAPASSASLEARLALVTAQARARRERFAGQPAKAGQPAPNPNTGDAGGKK